MRRGGWYRSPDGQSKFHLMLGKGAAPDQCMAPAMASDDVKIFGGRCARIAGHLCDAPVGSGTCDAPMCCQHRTPGGKNVDYCPKHAGLAPADLFGDHDA